jgi:integrase
MTAWLTPEDGASRSLPAGLSTEDIARIDTALEAHHAPSTLYSYGSAWRGFERWCHERGFTPLPAVPEVVCAYITRQAERGLTMGMVTSTLAAIAHRHISAGEPTPTDVELVRRVRRGLRRTLGIAPRRRARPLLVEDLRQILAAVDRTTAAGKRDAALILLGFSSALRRSELAALDVADLARKPGGMLITVRRSKGDPDAVGQTVAIAEGRWADSDPLAALDAWLRVRPRAADRVFTRVHANGTVSSIAITAASVARIVKTRAHAVGFSADRITAHSLRAGHATSAAMAGVSLDRIAAQTRHRDLGTLVNNYIRPIETMTTTSSRHLGL